ncbi:MAG: hypothetical protein LBJ08_02805, partial [Bifidobacteriaceae bacterium]|nr:hypothetical protein [Bifidobacteriaceae bacterium]
MLACSSVAPAQAAGEPALVNAEAVRPVIALMNQRNVLDNVVASVQDGAGLVLERLSSSIKKTASPECSPLNGAPGAWIRSCTVKATYGALFREVTFEVVDLSGFNPTIVGAPSPGALLTVAGVPAGLPVAYRWYHQNGADVSYEAAYTVQAADVGLAIQCDVSVTYGGINAIPGSGAVRTVRAGSVGKVQAVIAATLRRATIPHTTQGVVDLSLTVPSLGAWAGTVDVVVGANLVVIPIEMTGTAAVTLP